MQTTCGKIPYGTRAQAVVALGIYRDQLKRRGHGKDFRKLHVYLCPICPDGIFHLGRSNVRRISETEVQQLKKPSAPKPEVQPPAKKIPSTGELRRKLKRLEEKIDKYNQHRAFVYGQLIERDRQRDLAISRAAIGYQD
jgi:hypothetical protein